MADYIIELRDLCKYYGGIHALEHIDMKIERGRINALIGENGAGKSTLIRSLSCVEVPTSGDVLFNGQPIVGLTPKEAQALGIATVYQEPNQAMDLTVMENLYMDRMDKNKYGLIDYSSTRKRALALMDEVDIHIDPDAIVRSLSTAQRQMVEILRAMSYGAKFIIFDEPTSSLTTEETIKLFSIIRSLKEKGVTVLYVSHRMAEIFEICDYVLVFRDGKFVEEGELKDYNTDSLIRAMIGREIGDRFYKENVEIGEPILEVEHLSNSHVEDISFYLRKGEVLGFSGLVGAGRTEIMNSVFGLDPYTGTIRLNGKEITITSPEAAMKLGIAMVPEDRKREGVVPIMTIRENITLPNLGKVKKGLLLDRKAEAKMSERMVDRLRIKTPSSEQTVNNLSGGNQQKVVFAKWLESDPQIMILDEPTRGIDVGAKSEIYHIIGELVKNGISVIMISSEMAELMSICDRICCMREGRMVTILERNEFSEEVILKNIFGE